MVIICFKKKLLVKRVQSNLSVKLHVRRAEPSSGQAWCRVLSAGCLRQGRQGEVLCSICLLLKPWFPNSTPTNCTHCISAGY